MSALGRLQTLILPRANLTRLPLANKNY